ncbi:glycosyltransferase family 2 protein [Leuconostoc falkenbergense]|uniref:glycosyltransferase family 2 protein n=1 Tax=Leuconostoc falkenbergense TaxID=2766470 RepID=UPI00293CFACF|nr:glycosyltransferase family 2 protein [Leuconostoc falkenbergense]MDV3546766.1 glycosyltransferase family 2 protein [Leuconostoc falkenbergense]
MNDKISVIIPVYQEKLTHIEQSINSIKNQTYSNMEILVGLDDPTNILAIEYLTRQEKNNDNFRLYINYENLGLAENLNKLIQKSTGKYVARMDADDIAEKNRLEKQYKFLIENNLNFVSGAYDSIDESGNIIKISRKRDLFNLDIRSIEKYGNILAHPLWLVSRNILNNLKYRKVEPAEDYDLIARAMLDSNVKFGYLGESLLKYRIRVKSESHRNPVKSIIMAKRVSNAIRNQQSTNIEELNFYEEKSKVGTKIIKLLGVIYLIRYRLVRIYIENLRKNDCYNSHEN